jgi:hypothetical protein
MTPAPTPQPQQPAKLPVEGVKNLVAVASGKGGVGRTTVAVNLALKRIGASVGLLDAEVYGRLLLNQRDRHSVLIRKVLVQRTNADSRPFGNCVRRVSLKSMPLQNASRSLQHGVHRRGRTRLSGQFTGI